MFDTLLIQLYQKIFISKIYFGKEYLWLQLNIILKIDCISKFVYMHELKYKLQGKGVFPWFMIYNIYKYNVFSYEYILFSNKS